MAITEFLFLFVAAAHSCNNSAELCLRAAFDALPTSASVGSLVWECGPYCNGLGDRVRGIVSLFYVAVALRRKFEIFAPELDDVLVPSQYDWRTRKDDSSTCDTTLIELDTKPGQAKLLDHFQDRTAGAHKRVCVRTTFWFDMAFIAQFPLVFGSANWSNTKAYFGSAFRFLFAPTAALENEVHSILKVAQLPSFEKFGQRAEWNAVHYRVGLGKDAVRDSLELLPTFAAAVQQFATEKNWRAAVYIASDNAQAKEALVSMIPNGTLAPIDIQHVARNATAHGHLHAWAEFLILAHAHCVVASRSGFSYWASAAAMTFGGDDCYKQWR